MPYAELKTPFGTVSLNYTISTPTCISAEAIDPHLPTVIFIHPVYIAQTIYHPQFSDSQLRRFNLIALDSRGHGETKGPIPSNYGREMAADDVIALMDELNISACHFVGMEMGACTSLHTAITYPQRVLSLFLISPLPTEEPQEVLEGRQEIYDCWLQGFGDNGVVHEDVLLDALHGALELGFNGVRSSLITALIGCTFPWAIINWGPGKFEEFHILSVKYFKNRKPHPLPLLQGIQCPIRLVHCTSDIAYSLEHVEVLQRLLESAGADVQVSIVEDASHFGSVTHDKEVNSLLYDFLTKKCKCTSSAVPSYVTSPYERALLQAGWVKEETESDDEFM